MADLGQLQHIDPNADGKSEPSAELSLKPNEGNAPVTSNKATLESYLPTNTYDHGKHADTNGDANSPASTEIDPCSVASTNGVSSKAHHAPATSKKVTIKEPNDEAGNDLIAAELEDNLEVSNMPMDVGMGMGMGKKKRKKKPKSKRGLNAPTGFEEYYVDAPLTPAEHEEEKRIYDPSYSFTQRIETAIQRFVAKRKFDSEGTTLFDRYLSHGGVRGGPKMFGGVDAQTFKTGTAAEIAELAATHYVDSDKVDAFDSIYVVDFEACLRSFLSSQVPGRWDLVSEEKVKYLVGILRNFFNYLLHHDVCPEYGDQINAARALCDKAVKEIWNITQMTPLLPGDFNMACSELFGGMYQGMYSANQEWMEGSVLDYCSGISPQQARNAFKIGIAANADDELFPKYKQQLHQKTYHIISAKDTSFEVTEIVPANDTVLNLYAQQQCTGLKTIGKMRTKTWYAPHAADEDLTEQEEAELAAKPPEIERYEFWLEEEILRKCSVGMKFEATVRQTSFGLCYFDAINAVHCSFYHLLPNELMVGWKEIEKKWLPMRATRTTGGDIQEGVEKDMEDETAAEDGSGPKQGEKSLEKGAGNDPKAETVEGVDAVDEDAKVDTNMVAVGYDDDEGEEKPKDEEESAKTDEAMTEAMDDVSGVEVHNVGVELTEVVGNSEAVVEETFDVRCTAEGK